MGGLVLSHLSLVLKEAHVGEFLKSSDRLFQSRMADGKTTYTQLHWSVDLYCSQKVGDI